MPEDDANGGVLCCFRSTEGGCASQWHQGVQREHTRRKCMYMVFGLSLCITVDILQYSMPLAFLPSVLEDRGHAMETIATAIGIYYWAGFAGGAIITSYQILRLVRSEGGDTEEVTTVGAVRRQLGYLIISLGVSAMTLTGQAMYPRCWVHTVCRFTQGLAGAFIFFYAFLLSSNLFTGEQKTFALTMASTALNVAEVLGSTLGAYIYDRWGQEAVFFFMGIISVLNQLVLISMLGMITGNGHISEWYSEGGFRLTHKGWRRFKEVLRSERLHVAVLLIFVAAVIKGTVEEVLPFHADHRWHMGPLEIGNLFSLIAFAYIGASLLSGHMWKYLSKQRVIFSAFWMAMLALVTWGMFLVASFYEHRVGLWAGVMCYGVCLGVTHTPATLLLGDAVEHEEGRAKDAVNGIWNTMWEAGGSLGFLLGGLLAHDYAKQLRLFGSYVIFAAFCSLLMLYVGGLRDQHLVKPPRNLLKSYGSTSEHNA